VESGGKILQHVKLAWNHMLTVPTTVASDTVHLCKNVQTESCTGPGNVRQQTPGGLFCIRCGCDHLWCTSNPHAHRPPKIVIGDILYQLGLLSTRENSVMFWLRSPTLKQGVWYATHYQYCSVRVLSLKP
jgi:hypothetical protein